MAKLKKNLSYIQSYSEIRKELNSKYKNISSKKVLWIEWWSFGREINQIESNLFKNKNFEDRKEYYSIIRKSIKILKDEYDKIGKVCINDISKTALKNTENLRVYEDSGHLLSKGNFYVAKKINDELLSCGF